MNINSPQLESTYKFMAIDQYGNRVMIEKYPRKELLEHHGVSNISKIYIDVNGGHVYNVGYKVQSSWYDIYILKPWRPSPIN